MTELKQRIEKLKFNIVKSINDSGLALEVCELVLDTVHIQLQNQIEKMKEERNDEIRDDYPAGSDA
ncbi:hypothetical protein [Holdemania sp. 1001302B_160321_E10]|uniref:hypothetical protein n=1 Tax=Holdemania sp. 1001302B_160321_E10 TaxID=2787120 RepID=UPI00189C093F|nr:hypothetical protein [Holdemania sp. 1001302B_160321_E10]